MKQPLKLGFLLFIFFLTSCSKDDTKSEPVVQADSQYPTGTASFDANGYAFVATEARARYSSQGDIFAIELKNNDGRTIILRMENFEGVGIYTALNNSTYSNYTYRFNSDFVEWFSTENYQIEITAFDESDGILSGNFTIELEHQFSTLLIEQGIFENIPIIELMQPAPGNADFFLRNSYYHSDSAYAVITNNFQLLVFAPYDYRDRTLALKRYIGIGENFNYILPGLNLNIGQFSAFTHSLDEELMSIDFVNQSVSYTGKTKQTAQQSVLDFEINIKDIPIVSLPMEVDSGKTKLVIGSAEYEFTESAYFKSPENGGTYHFEATNSAGNKLIIDFTSNGNFNWNLTYSGISILLDFYENETDLEPTHRVAGLFGDVQDSDNQTAWVGFESDTVKMRAAEIPFFE